MSCDIVLPGVASDANKYSRGRLVAVAGSARYPGAAVLAALAAQRMGAGYTEVVTDEAAVDIVRSASPSLVVRPFPEWRCDEGCAARAERPCAVCLGPGFTGSSEFEAQLVANVLQAAACPVLVDGGALAYLGSGEMRDKLALRAEEGRATVLTPHGGEASRLAGALGVERTSDDSLSAQLARVLGCVVVLKGPDTFVSDGVETRPMREGTPALAKAGTGDVLAGIVGALLAQGLDPMDAAFTGAVLHARAGVLAAAELTEISVVAEDVVAYLPAAIAQARG